MGLRYRKSINLGGGFRVNLSKSGVGYSFGGKGFRYTHTARGTNRVTFSIPGTGISWSQETKSASKCTKSQIQEQSNYDHLLSIENADASTLTSAGKDDFVAAVKRYLEVDRTLTWLIPLVFLVVAFLPTLKDVDKETLSNILLSLCMLPIIVKLLYHNFARVRVKYEYDEFSRVQKENLDQAMEVLRSCSSVWQINDIFTNRNRRVSAGTSNSILRTAVKIEQKMPPFLITRDRCYYIKLKKEKLYILPDMMIITNGKKFSAIDLFDLDFNFDSRRFVEEDTVPKDAAVVDHTWKYVNNNGTPDRRYKGNRQLPVCLYGKFDIFTDKGVNMQFYVSNIEKMADFCKSLKGILEAKMNNISQQMNSLSKTLDF